ncbi:MAG: putative Ig domain-containing protein [Gammaproteobacteria bacterium]|nr:putative Ig domain-containing protein [Gammaproteobacteria bacterium]
MQGTNGTTVIRIVALLATLSLVLSGCLSDKEAASAADDNSGTPSGNTPPQISGNPATAVKVGDVYSFSPIASDPDGDSLTFEIDNIPEWATFNAATGNLTGQPTMGDIGVYSDILISANDGTATASLPRFSIDVNQVGTFSTTLSWTPPTQNEDGTPLTDLAGYWIYWGTTPGSYPNSTRIDNPGISSYVVENLAPGTYEFVATSFNAAQVQSAYSNPATKTLP